MGQIMPQSGMESKNCEIQNQPHMCLAGSYILSSSNPAHKRGVELTFSTLMYYLYMRNWRIHNLVTNWILISNVYKIIELLLNYCSKMISMYRGLQHDVDMSTDVHIKQEGHILTLTKHANQQVISRRFVITFTGERLLLVLLGELIDNIRSRIQRLQILRGLGIDVFEVESSLYLSIPMNHLPHTWLNNSGAFL